MCEAGGAAAARNLGIASRLAFGGGVRVERIASPMLGDAHHLVSS